MNTNSIRIVKLKNEYIHKIAEIEKQCFSEPWSENSIREEIENKTAYFIVAVDECGEAVAYGGMHTPCGDCYIDNIAVDKEHRRVGIGDMIVKALTAQAEKLGSFISLEVRASNANAVSLYMKNGFKKVGVRKNFYSDPREDALILTKYFERTD
jgi:ribosomal-protein-alanine N-acetyltransferase